MILCDGVTATLLCALIPLYHRLQCDDLAAQPSRRRLLVLLQREPGSSLANAGRLLSISPRSVAYHVRLLERAGIVVVRRNAGKLCLYLNGTAPSREQGADAITHPFASRILSELSKGPLSRPELRGRIPTAPRTTVYWHLRRLIALGWVQEQGGTSGDRRVLLCLSGSTIEKRSAAYKSARERT